MKVSLTRSVILILCSIVMVKSLLPTQTFVAVTLLAVASAVPMADETTLAPYKPEPKNTPAPYKSEPKYTPAPYKPEPKYTPAPYKPEPKYTPAPYKPQPKSTQAPYKPAPYQSAYKEPTYEEPPKYQYQYAVADEYSQANFGQSEARDGYVTNGEYRVNLPDGRTQIVTYTVQDGASGYVADVRYEGEPQYPAYEPKYESKPAYQPARNAINLPWVGSVPTIGELLKDFAKWKPLNLRKPELINKDSFSHPVTAHEPVPNEIQGYEKPPVYRSNDYDNTYQPVKAHYKPTYNSYKPKEHHYPATTYYADDHKTGYKKKYGLHKIIPDPRVHRVHRESPARSDPPACPVSLVVAALPALQVSLAWVASLAPVEHPAHLALLAHRARTEEVAHREWQELLEPQDPLDHQDLWAYRERLDQLDRAAPLEGLARPAQTVWTGPMAQLELQAAQDRLEARVQLEQLEVVEHLDPLGHLARLVDLELVERRESQESLDHRAQLAMLLIFHG
eukprot:snap_masked-scaffold317_size209118-processed-gene-1.17 protein:Tk01602 transcript:snap_masked-scaffold317_size209118-processed-gene-1.17-mRNA-1 annotation:"hypothetical protein DAPPUDRAFT_318118"